MIPLIHAPCRIYALDDQGKLVAEVTFPMVQPGVYCIDHTFVDGSLRGQGVAAQLVQAALAEIKQLGGSPTATCSYAAHWLSTHPQSD